MKSCLVLYFFFLATGYTSAFNDTVTDDVNSGPSSELLACSEIPTVQDAERSSTLRSKYIKGDSLTYKCQKGYVGNVIFICDGFQWKPTRNAKCSRKRCGRPEEIQNGQFVLLNGTDLTYGSTIKYICDTGYLMASLEDTRTCLSEGWSNHLPVCEEISCSQPVVQDNVIVKGLSENQTPPRYGHQLQFTCKSTKFKLVGPEEVICGLNGEWNKQFPVCDEVICKEEELNNVKIVNGVPGVVPPFKPKHSLTFQCVHSQWTLNGQPSITCREDGTWSSAYPTCSEVKGCGPPPHIQFADVVTSQTSHYSTGEKVEYKCQKLYTMSGQSYKTCSQGIWNGSFKCLKPCVVSLEAMDANKIRPLHGKNRVMYSPHLDRISFACQSVRQQKSTSVEFRQQCNDGVMHLPSCQ